MPRKNPPPPRRPGPPTQAQTKSALARVRKIKGRYEATERPFDPARAPNWRGSSRDLVVNRRHRKNASGDTRAWLLSGKGRFEDQEPVAVHHGEFALYVDPEHKDTYVVTDADDGRCVYLINPLELPGKHGRERLEFLWMFQHSPQWVAVWTRSLEDALEEMAGWADDVGMKGLFNDDEFLQQLTKEAIEDEGLDPDDEDDVQKAQDIATQDMTYTESGYISSDEWGDWRPRSELVQAIQGFCETLYEEEYGEQS